MARDLVPGIFTPTLSFFDEAGELDLAACEKHALRLAGAGVKGLVLQGSTGEAFSLTREERKSVVSRVCSALKSHELGKCLIIAGIGGQSLRESIAYATDAADAGADYGIALSPSFFVAQMDEATLEAYFTALADASPIPILIYNFPAVTNGIDLSPVLLARLSQHRNVAGVKLTCNSISKMQYLSPDGGNAASGFAVFSGSSQFLPAGHAAGFRGAITGMANMFPYTLVYLWEQIEQQAASDAPSAQRRAMAKAIADLQNDVAKYELLMMRDFIPANRATLTLLGQHAGHSRSPLRAATEAQIQQYRAAIERLAGIEQCLEGEAAAVAGGRGS